MEFKNIILIIKKNWKLILGLTILAIFLTLIFILTAQSKYEVNFSLLISQTQTQKTEEFKYDTYYALEAKDKIGDYLISFLKSPENVNTILNKADFNTKAFKPYDLRTFFKPYKASSQSIGMVFYLKDPSQAKNVVNSLLNITNYNLEKTYIAKETDAKFEVKSTNPLVNLKKPKIALNLIIVSITSFILSSLAILVKEYFVN
jgi:uncharacterized protein involved in exopolysaccharide biosynthesis